MGVILVRRIALIAFVLPLLFVSCGDVDITIDVDGDDVEGSGTLTTENRTVADFDQITLAGEGSVVVTNGPTSLSIRTDDNLLQHIETTVDGGTLRIATESGIDIDPTDSVVYEVSTPTLAGVTLSGAGSFDIGDWVVQTFSITLSGAGDIDFDSVAATSVDVTISGVGDINVAGQTDDLEVTISGAGSFDGADLQGANVAATTSGVGSATVWATQTLDAKVGGVGSIDYFGNPTVTESVTGLGSINSRGAK